MIEWLCHAEEWKSNIALACVVAAALVAGALALAALARMSQ